jgi:hypothetical protein
MNATATTTTPTPQICTTCGWTVCRRWCGGNVYILQVCSTNGCGTELDRDNRNYMETLDAQGKRRNYTIDGKIVCKACDDKNRQILT